MYVCVVSKSESAQASEHEGERENKSGREEDRGKEEYLELHELGG